MENYFVWMHSLDGTGGQASITRSVVSTIADAKCDVEVIEYGRVDKFNFHLFLLGFLRLVFFKGTIYSPVSRNFWGAFRDLPLYLLAFLGRPLVVHIHGSDYQSLFQHRVLGKFVSHVLRKRAKIIVTNCKAKTDLLDLGCCAITCIENFFPSEYASVRIEKKRPRSFFWNSNILATKGIFEFLEAFVAYSAGTSASLRVSGEILGCSLMSQHDTRARLNFFLSSPNIQYVGNLTRTETVSELANAEVCVLTSYSESQPLALIDGMCMGCRLLCSDLPELREMTSQYPMAIFSVVKPSAILTSIRALDGFHNVNPSLSAELAIGRFSEDIFREKLTAVLVKKDNTGD